MAYNKIELTIPGVLPGQDFHATHVLHHLKRWLSRATLLKWPDLRNLEVLWNMMKYHVLLSFTQYYLSLWRKAGGLPMRVEFMAIPTPKYSYSREIKIYVSQPWFALSRCFSRHSRKTTIEVSETRWECLTRLFMGRCWKAFFWKL